MNTVLRVGWVLALSAVAALSAAEEKVFRAGADRTDITPELGVLIVGSFSPTPAKHVHDPLYARTVVLDDGATRLAFVIVDNVGVPQIVCDEAKRLITEKTGLPRENVLIASNHNHSAGSARERADSMEDIRDGFARERPKLPRYSEFLVRKIADSVQIALNRLEPAQIAWGAGSDATHVFNRRWFVKSEANRRNPFGGVDQVRMNPPANPAELIKPAGPVDPEIAFLAVRAKSGRPIAVLANYSLHYVGGVPVAVISGDYFGVFDRRLGEMLGAGGGPADPSFVGIMSNGTSANINNINFRQRGPAMAPYEKMEKVGSAVAAEVYRAYQMLEYKDWVPLAVRYREVALKPRQATPEMVDYAKKVLAKPATEKPYHVNEKAYANWTLRAAEAQSELKVPLHALRIGDLGIAATPIETFVEVGLEIKEKTPFAKSFTISIANGSYGYMPTVEQHTLGGYESWLGTNRVELEAAPKMVSNLLEMLQEMR